MRYGKEGYERMDTCVTQVDGTLNCFLNPLPTVFTVFATANSEPFNYDSLIINVDSEDRDTTFFYRSVELSNERGSSYYWTTDSIFFYNQGEAYSYLFVPDNSTVIIEARYFNDSQFSFLDLDTLFCRKGVGNRYRIKN